LAEATPAPNLNYKKYVASAAGKDMIFPAASRFSDLFSSWKVCHSPLENPGGPWPLSGSSNSYIVPICYDSKNGNIFVVPSEVTLRCLDIQMGHMGDERIYFKLAHRTDGVLLVAEYTNIIGSRWLTLFGHGVCGEIQRALR
jgi:hypothetical protein